MKVGLPVNRISSQWAEPEHLINEHLPLMIGWMLQVGHL